MSAYLVDPEHVQVLLHDAVHRWPGQYGVSQFTTGMPSLVNAVEDRRWAPVRRLTSSTMDVIGQLLVDANAASVYDWYDEDKAYVYAWHRPRHTDWSPVELLSAIVGYECQACEKRVMRKFLLNFRSSRRSRGPTSIDSVVQTQVVSYRAASKLTSTCQSPR